MGIIDWLLKPLGWLFARHPTWRDKVGRGLLALGNRSYWILAFGWALAGSWSIFGHPFDNQLAHESFDLLMRQRPVPYKADTDIVVLNIDEASLAAMNAEFGRWPWPREVLAKVAQQLESSGAKAVVFDILFTDQDVANPASEAAFDSYVQSSQNSYYPAVRLNPANDGNSQIPVSMLKFARRDPQVPEAKLDTRRTVAMMAPYFRSIYNSARVGTNNIYPDGDNVVRWYTLFEPMAGYRIPSLPYRVAEQLNWPLPLRSHNLINWPRGLSPYTTVGFAHAFEAVRRNDAGFFKQFAGKVVVVGSTAPELNDIKATPVSSLYSGIYVLSTVFDNIKNDRFLRPLNPWFVWALELLLLTGSALLFTRTNQALAVAKYFFIVPVVLFGISLLSVSISNLLVDLSVPTAVVLGYFTLAKLVDANTRDFIAGTGPYKATPGEASGKLQIACLPRSVSREEVLEFLSRRGEPVKLWEPDSSGFGANWTAQGWVLWRWNSERVALTADNPPELAKSLLWIDVPLEDDSGGFSLAAAIATAAKSAREKV
jgi:CHASE2 domain-containing sensor protein